VAPRDLPWEGAALRCAADRSRIYVITIPSPLPSVLFPCATSQLPSDIRRPIWFHQFDPVSERVIDK